MDIYQKRYIKHQKRKKDQLSYSTGTDDYYYFDDLDRNYINILFDSRISQRFFNSNPISVHDIEYITSKIPLCPSSCDRLGVSYQLITDRHDKEILSGLLVGGVGWVYRANVIILLFADKQAYKAPGELEYMPYLDAGVVIQQIYLASTAVNVGCCFVNPNIRERNKQYFNSLFNKANHIYCGALALGYYDTKAVK
jgi:nitroreductase